MRIDTRWPNKYTGVTYCSILPQDCCTGESLGSYFCIFSNFHAIILFLFFCFFFVFFHDITFKASIHWILLKAICEILFTMWSTFLSVFLMVIHILEFAFVKEHCIMTLKKVVSRIGNNYRRKVINFLN